MSVSDFTVEAPVLTHAAVLEMLRAATEAAAQIGQPQCIVIVDASGETIGALRMSGAKYLSMKSARAKARTAASIGAPTTAIPEHVGPAIAAATEGDVTRLAGGLPIRIGAALVGGIGIGSGSPDQDVAVAEAALSAIGASA